MKSGDVVAIVLAVVMVLLICVCVLVPLLTFPIDIVFTWVDGNDPTWRSQLAQVNKTVTNSRHTAEREPTSQERDELFYSVPLAIKNLPFLRNVFIVTQRPQVPAWLPAYLRANPDARIKVVHHDEFFHPDVVRPTFNSNVIESQIPRIKGLANNFIMANDDVFVMRPMTKQMFFTRTGMPVVDFYPAHWLRDDKGSAFGNSLKRTFALQHIFQKRVTEPQMPRHVLVPMTKQSLSRVVTKLKKHVQNMKQVRSETDIVPYYLAINVMKTAPQDKNVTSEMYMETRIMFADPKLKNRYMICINNCFDDSSRAMLEEKLVE